MGDVVLFRKKVVQPEKSRTSKARKVYIGLNLYIDPVEDELDGRIDRNALHGVLSAFDFGLTRGLIKELFKYGGVHRIPCDETIARAVRSAIARRLPEIEVRLIKRIAA